MTFTSEDMYEAYLCGRGGLDAKEFWEWREKKKKEREGQVQ